MVFMKLCRVFLVFETYLLLKLHFKYNIQIIFSEREYWRVAKILSNTPRVSVVSEISILSPRKGLEISRGVGVSQGSKI